MNRMSQQLLTHLGSRSAPRDAHLQTIAMHVELQRVRQVNDFASDPFR